MSKCRLAKYRYPTSVQKLSYATNKNVFLNRVMVSFSIRPEVYKQQNTKHH